MNTNTMTRQELIDEVNRLTDLITVNDKLIKIKDKRIGILNESRENTLESCRLTLKAQKDKIRELEDGAFQTMRMYDALVKYLAHTYKRGFKLPQDYLKTTANVKYETEKHGAFYVIKEVKE